jgi:hypothetical protein
LSAVVYLAGLKEYRSIVRLAVFVGFIGYTSALLTLVMDIGRPDRFWHPWVYWNVHSVLWEITWCITFPDHANEFFPVVVETGSSTAGPGCGRWRITCITRPALRAKLVISLLHQPRWAPYGIVKAG